jgi:transcriptional regulator with XRE-family HTH domain
MGYETTTGHVGRRVREIRSWRGHTQAELAGLAGVSPSLISKIELGRVPVDRRQTLEKLAVALRVAPMDLTDRPETASDAVSAAAHATLVEIEAALDRYELGADPEVPVREWPAIAADVRRLVELMHLSSDYAAQGELVPGLLGELHAAYLREPQHRAQVLLGLVHCYSSVCWVSKRLGGRGLPTMAAQLAQRAADELESPQWRGYTAWQRGAATGRMSRELHLRRSVAAADELTPHLDDDEVLQAYGMLHLSAALAAAAQDDRDTAATHLDEAEQVAARMHDEVGRFGHMWFGAPNVGVWRTVIATELGESGKVPEIARTVNIEVIPSPSRRAEFYAEVGRNLVGRSHTREQGETALMRAYDLAPQRVVNDVFVREVVADRIRADRRNAGGRAMRFLAWQMGLAPAS